ncbi:RagB/SusD family nutrient uptake outer membrane protein [Niastella vici]|uniref:RagB/SusD family nutrient uptake outer membrane protein n=1 Tax=Niastella vici TaxID=1703345 RepID=UPI00373FD83C
MSIVFRAAEIYLIRAEARAQQNNLTGAAADLNVIRSRAGLPATTATTPTEYLDAIFRERKFELFTEWGHRWFDLIRTGNANTVLGALKPTWRPTAALFPIVTQVLLSNPQLTQNPGY